MSTSTNKINCCSELRVEMIHLKSSLNNYFKQVFCEFDKQNAEIKSMDSLIRLLVRHLPGLEQGWVPASQRKSSVNTSPSRSVLVSAPAVTPVVTIEDTIVQPQTSPPLLPVLPNSKKQSDRTMTGRHGSAARFRQLGASSSKKRRRSKSDHSAANDSQQLDPLSVPSSSVEQLGHSNGVSASITYGTKKRGKYRPHVPKSQASISFNSSISAASSSIGVPPPPVLIVDSAPIAVDEPEVMVTPSIVVPPDIPIIVPPPVPIVMPPPVPVVVPPPVPIVVPSPVPIIVPPPVPIVDDNDSVHDDDIGYDNEPVDIDDPVDDNDPVVDDDEDEQGAPAESLMMSIEYEPDEALSSNEELIDITDEAMSSSNPGAVVDIGSDVLNQNGMDSSCTETETETEPDSWPCGNPNCDKNCVDNCIGCNSCGVYFHRKCLKWSLSKLMSYEGREWLCFACSKSIPPWVNQEDPPAISSNDMTYVVITAPTPDPPPPPPRPQMTSSMTSSKKRKTDPVQVFRNFIEKHNRNASTSAENMICRLEDIDSPSKMLQTVELFYDFSFTNKADQDRVKCAKALVTILKRVQHYLRDEYDRNFNVLDPEDYIFGFFAQRLLQQRNAIKLEHTPGTYDPSFVSKAVEAELFNRGVLGVGTADSLLNTVLYYNTTVFGISKAMDHSLLEPKHIECHIDSEMYTVRVTPPATEAGQVPQSIVHVTSKHDALNDANSVFNVFNIYFRSLGSLGKGGKFFYRTPLPNEVGDDDDDFKFSIAAIGKVALAKRLDLLFK